jgi:hypothetical protein
MKTRSWFIGSLMLGLAASAAAQQANTGDETSWQQHRQQMQEYRQAWQDAKTPEERQKLRESHWQAMHSGMMANCPVGMQGGKGMPGGKGMQGGGMMNAPTKEMLDMRIEQAEQMLEQMRSHREMLDKQ